ncbi:nucleoside 2-deoxyribosyltransferase [Ornithinibacillus halotolerans]|uniref:Group-specific protein n=1 Tax=Ornithinibacillus halotolerans TaxID=1274357 RepID=A0A916RT93_9BACI|nr:nucleoside 2-deoxyribosyltransferase [Ornithinibacillus halotolerans]GGA70071.1 hypothetical protein GCM10008025_12500 [Ornithinibacillus halotolerans]
MKFYIASGLENKEIVQIVRDELIEAGHIHTYDWTQNNRATTKAELQVIGEAERKAVSDSDVILILLPGGKGTHTELGMAIALGKKIHLYSKEKIQPTTASSFYYVDNVERFAGNLKLFIDEIIQLYS